MEPLLILIVIPAFAGLMLRADTLRTNGLDPESREFWRKLMPLLSFAVWGLAVIFLYKGFSEANTEEGRQGINLILTGGRFCLGFGLIYLGWKNLLVSRHDENENLTLREIVRRDLESTSARSVALLFVLLPIALPSLIVMSTIGFIPLLIYTVSAYPQQSIQNQLLWTLALGTRNQLNLGNEVYSLANSLVRESQSRRAVILKILGGVLCLLLPILLVFFVPLYFRNRSRKRVIRQLKHLASALYDGVPLEEAVSLQSGLLPAEIVGAIQATTEEGRLGEVLSQIALEHSRRIELQSESKSSLNQNSAIYAVVLIGMLINVTAFIMYWIVPKYKAIFQDFGVELPRLTEIWIEVSDVVVGYWYLIGPFLFLPLMPLFLGSILMLDQTSWIPWHIKRLIPRVDAPMLLRRLGYLAANNLPLQPSLLGLAESTPDFGCAQRYERLERRLDQGDELGDALFEEGFINRREAYSISSAAEIGHLGWALGSIASAIDQRRFNRSRWVTEFTRPLVVIMIAFFVASFCAAMFIPLVKLVNDLS